MEGELKRLAEQAVPVASNLVMMDSARIIDLTVGSEDDSDPPRSIHHE